MPSDLMSATAILKLSEPQGTLSKTGHDEADGMHCGVCGGSRRMKIHQIYPEPVVPVFSVASGAWTRPPHPSIPRLFLYVCVQCQQQFTTVLYKGPAGASLVVLPSVRGGLSTEHTPQAVAYYLDQAARSEATGAQSAAVAMYRSALDCLLQEQGFKGRMAGDKLRDMTEAIQAKQAPAWAMDLEKDFLDQIKLLGDGGLHSDDLDVAKQQALDVQVLATVQTTFAMLLLLVYEVPHAKQENLMRLKAATAQLKK